MESNIYMCQAFQGEAENGVSGLRVKNLLSLFDVGQCRPIFNKQHLNRPRLKNYLHCKAAKMTVLQTETTPPTNVRDVHSQPTMYLRTMFYFKSASSSVP